MKTCQSTIRILSILIIILCLTVFIPVHAQQNATVIEVYSGMPTYGFSDPNPIPKIDRIYPYFRFDGYSAKAENKKWQFIELENDFIKVFITPEIGGKIWGAIEKSTGKEFIYFNHVVKFRDVAMRGPWTSGGIEANFGVIGHAPTCSTPVDYLIRRNEDGSVSCFIGAIDLPSRTEWRVEINLQPDKAYFTTKALWHNRTSLQQSYYQWMNAGVKAAGNLEFAYPGSNYIGHDGSLHSWPIHPEGMDISWYEKNNFGGYKSYHILGELTNFFGGYWHNDNFGFGHYSNYAGKPGKKLWIWGLSRQGMIWEDLLTDSDGQYVEIQSGRLFNQEANTSVLTPYKHRSFAPFATDVWTEYWFPVMKTEGVVQATPSAAINLEQKKHILHLWISANRPINDTLTISCEGENIEIFNLVLAPTQVAHKTITYQGRTDEISVKLGAEYIIAPGGTAAQKLSRPLTTVDFDWSSVQGLSMKALALEQERNYIAALEYYFKCLQADQNYIPALVGAAGIELRNGKYKAALALASRVLAIDTYNPAANFIYGTVNARLGNIADAIDGFSIASASMAYKSAAYLELAKIYFLRKDYAKSIEFSIKSLDYNQYNLSAKEFLLLAYRKSDNRGAFQSYVTELLKADPLNHFARFENYLFSETANNLELFKSTITNELPHETYLELAIKYYNLGLPKEALSVLTSAPNNPLVSYWYSYLAQDIDPAKSKFHLLSGNSLEATLIFPFRQESIKILEWAAANSNSWKPNYYLGLIYWHLGQPDKTKELFTSLRDAPDFSPFYLAKAKLFADNSPIVLESLLKAQQLSPDDWRTALKLSAFYVANNKLNKAIDILEPAFKSDPENYYVGLSYAKTLMLDNRNQGCLNLLQGLTVLPNEGATEGYHLHRVAGLNLATKALMARNYDSAYSYLNVARSWPENLGVGKPYITDERIENYLQGLILIESGKKKKGKQLFKQIVHDYDTNEAKPFTAEDIITLATYLQLDDQTNVSKIVSRWNNAYPNNDYVKWAVGWLNGSAKGLNMALTHIDKTNTDQKIGSGAYYLEWTINFLNDNPIKQP